MRALLVLAAPLLLYAQQFTIDPAPPQSQPRQPPGALSGTLTDSATGQPIRGAQVTLQHYGGGGMNATSTDAAGAFFVDNLTPGDYYIQAMAPSYPGPLGLPQTGEIFSVESGKTNPDANLRLTPGGSISGHVLSDDGEPLANCRVLLTQAPLGPGPLRQSSSAQTGDDGEFQLAPLAPDRYLLSVRCSEALPVEHLLDRVAPEPFEPGAAWRTLYYPDSPTLAGATPLGVAPGGNVQIEMHLTPTPVTTLSGIVTAAPGLQTENRYYLTLAPAGGEFDPAAQLSTPADSATNRFRFRMVPPGSYELSVLPIIRNAGPATFASQLVNIGNAPPQPLVLPVQPTITLTGKVVDPPASSSPAVKPDRLAFPTRPPGPREQRQPAKGAIEFLSASGGTNGGSRAAEISAEDGSFSVVGLTPGNWRIRYHNFQGNAYVESVQYGDTTITNSVIPISPGASTPLTVKLSTVFPNLQYELKDAPAQSKDYWMVQAVPGSDSGAPDRGVAGIALAGRPIQASPLAPGRYSFFAIQQTVGGGMRNERITELLRRQVPPIEIAAGRDQTIPVRCFSREEITRIVNAYLSSQVQ